ncbi:CYTH and CHAD domain-containing protein [Rhodococcus sp. 105337]|uniref:CYTH and CHAD domain-containing protein n=1 Tax=Rhodococcus sp. 105337 TaxID=2725310 RepID=UPI00146E0EF5|nr:CYTH and CHAD domain-containing protein [Rhodococcus sp. 105337]NME78879.1 CYTH and CHAD domain-containing protein [Rhodococcus sp. 105337]
MPQRPTVSSATETERKYTAGGSASLPDLTGLPRVSVVEVDTVELSAQYYDTADLRLLQSAITLRRREGGDDAGWHVKLPNGADTRTELHFPLADADGKSADEPPAELMNLLVGVRRGLPVSLAALLTTTRHRHRIRGKDETLLAEVVEDDVVAVRGGDDEEMHWQEIEVEAGSSLGRGDRSTLLDAIEERLTAAGIVRSPSPSKVHRVLGDLLPAAPELGEAARFLRDYLARELHALELSDIAVRRDEPDAIHSMRKASRRIRSALHTYADDFALGDALVDELRWFGRRLSPSRDLEVQWKRLAGQVDEIPGDRHREATKSRIDEYFSAKTGAARTAALATLDSERYLVMLRSLDDLVGGLGSTPPARSRKSALDPEKLTRSVATVAKKVDKRVARVRKAHDPHERDELMHRARKGAKRMRYAIEVIAPLHPKRTARILDRFDEFQDMLGEFQDSVVSREHLLDIVSDQGHTAESSFGLGILYRLETEVGRRQAAQLEPAWKSALGSAGKLWE